MKQTLLILVGLTILAFALRFFSLASNPPGLTVDEVSTGYNAYSILKTGKDEYGNFFPITFKSLGDYKPLFYIYASTIPIAIFGLNEFSTRFLSALVGSLSIPLSFFLFRKITDRRDISLVGALLFAISPWHIYYSRLAFESPVAMSLVMAGVYSFLKMLEGKYRWAILSAGFFLLSLYTYHSERIFLPLFIIWLLYFYRKVVKKQKRCLLIFFSILILFCLPLIYSLLFGQAAQRAGMTLITKDPDFVRNVFSPSIQLKSGSFQHLADIFGSKYLLLLFFILDKFISYLQPQFLFFYGLGMTQIGSFGLGALYFFEIPTFILGIWSVLSKKIKQRGLIMAWIFLGLIPATITQDLINPIRLLLVAPMVILLSAIGVTELYRILQKLGPQFRLICWCLGWLFISWNLLYAFLIFTVHFPTEKSEDFLYGSKDSVSFALSQKNNYREIILDPMRGTINPDIRSVPHLYLLFYAKYDPYTYQNLPKRTVNGIYGFDKFTVRQINWLEDKNKKGVLFIGSPWVFANSNLTQNQIKQKFYLLDGQVALMAVSP